MPPLNIPPDDLGRHRLPTNPEPSTRQVTEIAPYPMTSTNGGHQQESESRLKAKGDKSAAEETDKPKLRRGKRERRRGNDRRKKSMPVILDTRSKRERRKTLRGRRQDDEGIAAQGRRPLGIDERT